MYRRAASGHRNDAARHSRGVDGNLMGIDRDVMVGALWALFYRPIPHLVIPKEKRPGRMQIGTFTYWTSQIVSFGH